MSTALLINPSYRRTYGSNEGGLAFPVFPVLSLATMAGDARDRGHHVEILDLSYRRYDPALVRATVAELRPDVVGITATTPLANQLRDMSYLIHDIDRSIVVVGGGAHPSALPELTLRQSDLDGVIVGEADRWLSTLLSGTDLSCIAGAQWLAENRVQSNDGALVENLDELPWAAWDLYPRDCQASISDLVVRHRPVATVEFSRGCLYRCDFCGSKNTMGFGYRKKSPQRCAEEFELLARHGFREAVLVDDIFTSDADWAAEVCEALIAADTGVAWTCSNGIRVDSTSPELFELLRRAGCYRVHFGFESGDDRVLRSFGKGGRASLDLGRAAVEHARQAGLEVNGYFMVGLTDDTTESMRATVDFARTLPLDASKCGLAVPFPGTEMFRRLHEGGRIRTFDWDAYTVYNSAEEIFDHPTLAWPEIRSAFRGFYIRNYLTNPAFVWRRTTGALRERSMLSQALILGRYLRLAMSSDREDAPEAYEFADRWRPSDSLAATPFPPPTPMRAKTRGGATKRDGLVTPVNVNLKPRSKPLPHAAPTPPT